MPSHADLRDRNAFAERLRLQLQARYRDIVLSVDAARFAIRAGGPGVNTVLPLAAIHSACQRDPQNGASLIAGFVRAVEPRLVPAAARGSLSLARLLWCVRSRSYLDDLSRREDLLAQDLPGNLVAFVAETLPGMVMRGVPRDEWRAQELGDETVRAATDLNTAARFRRMVDRIASIERVPRDGWRLTGDNLFQGSLLMVAQALRVFADRAGGDVLLAVPDRAVMMALAATAPGADRFAQRVLREYRDAATPCSSEVLITDGNELRAHERVRAPRASTGLLAWLRD